jgi:hypothetical protein
MVVALVALVSSLTGGAVAATLITAGDLAKNAVRSPHIKNRGVKGKDIKPRALKTAHVKDGSLLRADFRRGQLPAGEQGPQGDPGEQGPKGDKGDPGDPATTLFGTIQFDGSPSTAGEHGLVSAERTGTGTYAFIFDRAVFDCVAFSEIGTQLGMIGAYFNNAVTKTSILSNEPRTVHVSVYEGNQANQPVDSNVVVGVVC